MSKSPFANYCDTLRRKATVPRPMYFCGSRAARRAYRIYTLRSISVVQRPVRPWTGKWRAMTKRNTATGRRRAACSSCSALFTKAAGCPAGRACLLNLMTQPGTGPKRLKGRLPAGTHVGLVTLPICQTMAIATFVADAPADAVREAVIARLARAAWDHSGFRNLTTAEKTFGSRWRRPPARHRFLLQPSNALRSLGADAASVQDADSGSGVGPEFSRYLPAKEPMGNARPSVESPFYLCHFPPRRARRRSPVSQTARASEARYRH